MWVSFTFCFKMYWIAVSGCKISLFWCVNLISLLVIKRNGKVLFCIGLSISNFMLFAIWKLEMEMFSFNSLHNYQHFFVFGSLFKILVWPSKEPYSIPWCAYLIWYFCVKWYFFFHWNDMGIADPYNTVQLTTKWIIMFHFLIV